METCPYRRFEASRKATGVTQLAPNVYAITRYADVVSILTDPANYSAQVGASNSFEAFGPSPVLSEIRHIMRDHPETPALMGVDAPKHTRVRKLVGRALTPAVVEKLESQIRLLAANLMTPWIQRGSVEFVSSFSARLPSAVTTSFLGSPPEMEEKFCFWAGEVMSRLNGPQTPERQLEVARNIAEMGSYFLEQIENRRANPNGDLVSLLANAEIDGDRLENDIILTTIETFLIGGHETTTFVLGESFYRLAQHPALADQLRRDPAAIPAFIEEMLRISSPTLCVLRSPKKDVKLNGVAIPAGAVLQVAIASANRDEDEFAAPEEFSLGRPKFGAGSRHVAFGYGEHTCIGMHLARTEIRVALETLLPSMPNLRLGSAQPIDRMENFMLRGPTRLDLAFG